MGERLEAFDTRRIAPGRRIFRGINHSDPMQPGWFSTDPAYAAGFAYLAGGDTPRLIEYRLRRELHAALVQLGAVPAEWLATPTRRELGRRLGVDALQPASSVEEFLIYAPEELLEVAAEWPLAARWDPRLPALLVTQLAASAGKTAAAEARRAGPVPVTA